MFWIGLTLLGIVVLVILLVLVTDGRYFGKGLMLFVYDHVGPKVFGAHRESGTWHRLIDKLDLRGDERVLDVGTAVGDLPLTLASMPSFRGQVVGVDWSQRMVTTASEEAKQRGLERRVAFQVADLRQGLPCGDGEFDVVICLGLLETLPSPERALQELRRVLMPDGTMVLSLYSSGLWSKVSALSLAWYEKHLAALGLERVETVPCRRSQDAVIAWPRKPAH
ncbi:MAG TPA: class I SAM-dependent methyltransferase [Candidatus Acetothermia bacterium]|nr:class I SAM-dependent methyltransferase [Candidatus Acetothermia bacterium]